MAVRDWDPTPYPDARPTRNQGLGDVGLEVIAPTPRLWSGMIAWGAGPVLGTAVSPKYVGPAIIRLLTIRYGLSNAVGEQCHILLLKSLDSSGQGEVAYGQPPPSGVSIVETSFQPGAPLTNTAYRDGFFINSAVAHVASTNIPLQYTIGESEFYLKLCAAMPGAAAGRLEFTVSLYERIDPNTMLDLLGGL